MTSKLSAEEQNKSTEPENDGYSYGFGKLFPQGTVHIFLTEGFFQRETVCQGIRKGGDFRCNAMFRKAIHGCSPISAWRHLRNQELSQGIGAMIHHLLPVQLPTNIPVT